MALLAGACDEVDVPSPNPPLDPVSRVAAMNWTVSQPDTQWAELAEEAAAFGPTSIVLAGAHGARLDEDGGASCVADLDALAAELDARSLSVGLAVEAGVLGPLAPSDVCFDPERPTADPYLLARSTAWRDLLEANPEIRDTVLRFDSVPSAWDVDCTCTACDDSGERGMALRLDGAFAALTGPADETGRGRWWSSRLPMASAGDLDLVAAMDLALTDLRSESGLRVLASSSLGPAHPWAPESPWLGQGRTRQVGAEIDLVGSAFGPTELPVVLLDDLHDRIQRNRARGIVAWFVAVDGGGRTPWGRPEAANVDFVRRLFHDLDARPEDLIAGWVEDRYGLSPTSDEGQALALALRNTGRAVALATHPLGIPVAGMGEGIGPLPLAFVDPRPWDDAWEERWQALAAPDLQVLVDAHQWGAEAVAIAQDAQGSLALAQGALGADDAQDLRTRLLLLHAATRAWALVVGADLGVKARQIAPSADLDSWLRSDAAQLDALADEVEAATQAGELGDTFPVDPVGLRSIAGALLEEVGEGPAQERPFPEVTQVRWSTSGGQTDIWWTLRPGGSSWWERTPSPPTGWEAASETGPGPSVFWHAYTHLDPDERVVFRPCGMVGDVHVCASDNVLWSPP